MKKIGIFLFMLCCFSGAYASGFNSFTNTNIKSFTDKGYILSDKFLSFEECNTQKDKYNLEYSSYKRSSCFETEGKFQYFICNLNDSCSLTDVSSSNVQSLGSSSMSGNNGNQSVTNKDKLDKFISKLSTMRESTTPEKFKKTLDSVASKLEALEKKYSSNATIKNMIVYLNNGVKGLYEESDVDNFFCELTGTCNEIAVNNINTSTTTTTTNNNNNNNNNSSVNTSINNTNQSMNDQNIFKNPYFVWNGKKYAILNTDQSKWAYCQSKGYTNFLDSKADYMTSGHPEKVEAGSLIYRGKIGKYDIGFWELFANSQVLSEVICSKQDDSFQHIESCIYKYTFQDFDTPNCNGVGRSIQGPFQRTDLSEYTLIKEGSKNNGSYCASMGNVGRKFILLNDNGKCIPDSFDINKAKSSINTNNSQIKEQIEINNSLKNTSISNTNQSMNDINKKDECKKMQLFGNISICDTGKKGTYQDMNNLCPAGYHVPNYWEMDYIIKSGVVLDFTESSYYINSLYSDIVKVDSYPFAKYPFLLKRFNNQYTMNHTSDLTWLNNLSKENILCINNDANTPKSDTNGANWTSCGVNFDNLIGKYNLSRKYLIRDEKIIIESLSNQLLKGNIDYVVQLECSDKGLLKKESIKKVNSCNYGYKLQNNDCIVDPLICNLENFGNTHPTNGMICSWKNLGEEKKDYGFFRYGLLNLNKQFVGYSSELDIRLNGENNEMKKNMLKKYQTQYNNKVDIDINCQLSENKDGIRDDRDFNVFTSCKINGLFWQ